MDERYKEIQELIESIAATAKLIGYTVEQTDYDGCESSVLRDKGQVISISHFKKSNRIKVLLNQSIIIPAGKSLSQSEKIKGLEKVLQHL